MRRMQISPWLFAAALSFGVLASTAQAQAAREAPCDLEQGRKLLFGGPAAADRAAGLEAIQCAAKAGHPEAQTFFATLLSSGIGTPKDPVQAAAWLEKAVAQGHAPAMTRLAFAHLMADGVAPDKARARALLTQAAGLGDPQAMANLGAMYGMGDGVARDDRLAARWYLNAAQRGDRQGQMGYANMAVRGHGMPANPAACFVYASLAARQQTPRAQELANECGARLTPDALAQAKSDLEHWRASSDPR